MGLIDHFEKLLDAGQDNALLRFSLGQAYFKEGEHGKAVEHLERAIQQDPTYSAAWKIYAKALGEAGRIDEAIEAYTRGIEVAEGKGDIQAAKEMKVFRKRLEKPKAN